MLSSDPTMQRIEQERRARSSLVRNAVIWMPLFLIAFGALLWFAVDVFFNDGERGGTYFLLVVLSVFSFLFGYQGIHATLDLIQGDTTMEGIVTRRQWNEFVMAAPVIKSHYIRGNRSQIFRIDNYYHGDAKAGDVVRVRYYPRSAVVIELERLEIPLEDDADTPAEPDTGSGR